MKFRLETTRSTYKNEERAKFESLGFHFELAEDPSSAFVQGETNRIKGSPVIEFSTAEELARFVEEYGPIVIDRIYGVDGYKDGFEIEIYNGYRE